MADSKQLAEQTRSLIDHLHRRQAMIVNQFKTINNDTTTSTLKKSKSVSFLDNNSNSADLRVTNPFFLISLTELSICCVLYVSSLPSIDCNLVPFWRNLMNRSTMKMKMIQFLRNPSLWTFRTISLVSTLINIWEMFKISVEEDWTIPTPPTMKMPSTTKRSRSNRNLLVVQSKKVNPGMRCVQRAFRARFLTH